MHYFEMYVDKLPENQRIMYAYTYGRDEIQLGEYKSKVWRGRHYKFLWDNRKQFRFMFSMIFIVWIVRRIKDIIHAEDDVRKYNEKLALDLYTKFKG